MRCYKTVPAMTPAAAIAEGMTAPAPVPTPAALPVVPSVDCLFTLKACGAFMCGDALCCLPFCHCCGGCCGKYDACVVHAVGPELAGVTKPGPERCWQTCMLDVYACSSAFMCCGCFLCCCGLGAPIIEGLVIKTERNKRDVAVILEGVKPQERMVR